MFDGEHGIALHAILGNWASSRGKGEVSWLYSICSGNLGCIIELQWGWPFKTRVCSVTSGLCLVARDTSGSSQRPGSAIRTPLEVSWETQSPFPVCTGILGFLSVFKRSQTSSPFEALNSGCLLRCQRDMGPPVEMRPRTTAFSRVSTGDSDIPSSCEMKD